MFCFIYICFIWNIPLKSDGSPGSDHYRVYCEYIVESNIPLPPEKELSKNVHKFLHVLCWLPLYFLRLQRVKLGLTKNLRLNIQSKRVRKTYFWVHFFPPSKESSQLYSKRVIFYSKGFESGVLQNKSTLKVTSSLHFQMSAFHHAMVSSCDCCV